jgi:hypothetical protein
LLGSPPGDLPVGHPQHQARAAESLKYKLKNPMSAGYARDLLNGHDYYPYGTQGKGAGIYSGRWFDSLAISSESRNQMAREYIVMERHTLIPLLMTFIQIPDIIHIIADYMSQRVTDQAFIIDRLWHDEGVQNVYAARHTFQSPLATINIDYLLERVMSIGRILSTPPPTPKPPQPPKPSVAIRHDNDDEDASSDDDNDDDAKMNSSLIPIQYVTSFDEQIRLYVPTRLTQSGSFVVPLPRSSSPTALQLFEIGDLIRSCIRRFLFIIIYDVFGFVCLSSVIKLVISINVVDGMLVLPTVMVSYI